MDVHFKTDSLVKMRWYTGGGLKAVLALREWSKRREELEKERLAWISSLGADALGTVSDASGLRHFAMLVWMERPAIVPPGSENAQYAEEEKCWYAFPENSKAGLELQKHFDWFDPTGSAARIMLDVLGVDGEIRLPDGSRRRPVAMPMAGIGRVCLVVPDDGRNSPDAPQAPSWMEEVSKEEFQALQAADEEAVRKAAAKAGLGGDKETPPEEAQ